MAQNDESKVERTPDMTVDERVAAYNAERKVLDDKYGFVLMADAYIDTTTGTIRARPTVVPVEVLPKPEEAEQK